MPLFSAGGPGAIPTSLETLFSGCSLAILGRLLLGFPSGVLQGRARLVAGAGYLAALVLQPLPPLFQPASNHCPAGGPNPFVVADSPMMIDVFNVPAPIAVGVVAAGTLAILFGRWRRASPPGPVLRRASAWRREHVRW